MCCLILEYCPYGCIYDILQLLPTHSFTEIQIIKIIKDVSLGLIEIHNSNMAHRDIKIENILLGADNCYKICDFGSVSNKFYERVEKE